MGERSASWTSAITVLAALGLSAVLAVGTCRPGPRCSVDRPWKDDAARSEALRADRLAREAGSAWCPALFPLRLVARGGTVELRGAWRPVLGGGDALPAGRLVIADPIVQRLRDLRAAWKEVNPGRWWAEEPVEIDLEPSLDADRARSIVMSAAIAGSDHVRVRAGDASFDAWVWVEPHQPKPRVVGLIVEGAGDGFVVRFAAEHECLPPPRRAARVADLGAVVTAMCAGQRHGCADRVMFVLPGATTARELVQAAASTLASPALGSRAVVSRPVHVVFAKSEDEPAPAHREWKTDTEPRLVSQKSLAGCLYLDEVYD